MTNYLEPLVQRCICWWIAKEFEGKDHVLHFEVAAGCERVKGLLQDVFRIFEAGEDGAGVDEIEFFMEDPFVFGIVDFEAAVGRDAERGVR